MKRTCCLNLPSLPASIPLLLFTLLCSALPGAAKRPSDVHDALWHHRNLGKAYYEQGKYPEAIAEFQKVAASGRAVAADHLDLGMSLVQANNLDAALV